MLGNLLCPTNEEVKTLRTDGVSMVFIKYYSEVSADSYIIEML